VLNVSKIIHYFSLGAEKIYDLAAQREESVSLVLGDAK